MTNNKPKPTRAKAKTILGVFPDKFSPIQKELDLAYKRIDGKPIRRLRWLLDFAYSDLNGMSEGKLTDLGWEVVMFGINKSPKRISDDFETYVNLTRLTVPWGKEDFKRHEEERKQAQDPTAPFDAGRKVSLDLIRWFQVYMRERFEALYDGGSWDFLYPPTRKLIAIPHYSKSPLQRLLFKGRATPVEEPLSADQLLLIQAFELLDAEKDRLMICENPKCRRKFVATKKGRSRFHSPTCSAYVRIRKSRGHPV